MTWVLWFMSDVLFILCAAYISTGQIMGWGNKAIEIRSAETGHLDGVFMHKKAQKLKFLCERNDKVRGVTNLPVWLVGVSSQPNKF